MKEEYRVNKAKEGDKFIKPDSKKIYIVKKLVFKGDWVVLREEDGTHQILTSQESLKTWIQDKRGGTGQPLTEDRSSRRTM